MMPAVVHEYEVYFSSRYDPILRCNTSLRLLFVVCCALEIQRNLDAFAVLAVALVENLNVSCVCSALHRTSTQGPTPSCVVTSQGNTV